MIQTCVYRIFFLVFKFVGITLQLDLLSKSRGFSSSVCHHVHCRIIDYYVLWSYLLCSIPDSVGKDIEKVCQSIYPLHDVYIRKVKILKKPKFDRKSASLLFSYMQL